MIDSDSPVPETPVSDWSPDSLNGGPTPSTQRKPPGALVRWLLQGAVPEPRGPYEAEEPVKDHTHPWWKVMCLTGVDYFSTLGYQPGIAALAAGALAPLATLVLVLLTLFGALPMYKRVAAQSPHGDGSISMLERLLPWWQGKLFVLCLIGFVATGFVITITLSAADATAHITENPFTHFLHGQEILITLFLIALLGAVFMKGFGEAIGIAVALVGIYIFLNIIVIGSGFWQILHHPEVLPHWKESLFASHSNVLGMVGAALLLFPKLALGLSGFETGVVVMPLVRGKSSDTPQAPTGRIENTCKLLTTAALIMSVLLICSSLVTTLLIPSEEFRAATETSPGGAANGRALAYVAHKYLGNGFGTIYDISTITILWFAGASAMAGLLNIVPRYLPRYGMAPEWTRANRPLVLIFIGICFLVTIIFRADVDEQAGAYATGVLALMTSATIAVTLSVYRKKALAATVGFGLVTLIFTYTTFINIKERPEGLKIAGLFILAIVLISFISRTWRTTELRIDRVELDETAQRFINEANAIKSHGLRIIANKRDMGDPREYAIKEDRQREDSHIPASYPILFLEVHVRDASDFSGVMQVTGVEIEGYRVLRAEAPTVPNAIAALLLHLRETTGRRPHGYFAWSEGAPLLFMLRYLFFGEGDTAPVTREVLRKAEPDPGRRPILHVDG
ncbi:hypothetical protein IAD21_05572 [Abditibacteriota bacterium]|nr:hypothetical protein IAD21_05572 [Abditibacteriota bacterium]